MSSELHKSNLRLWRQDVLMLRLGTGDMIAIEDTPVFERIIPWVVHVLKVCDDVLALLKHAHYPWEEQRDGDQSALREIA